MAETSVKVGMVTTTIADDVMASLTDEQRAKVEAWAKEVSARIDESMSAQIQDLMLFGTSVSLNGERLDYRVILREPVA